MGTIFLLFIVLPAVELALLIEVGSRIGTLETLGLIVITGLVGGSLARSQGLRVLRRVQEQVGAGEMPADSLVDGVMILVAGALLVTPGVLTDAFGLLCLVPAFRGLIKRELVRRFKKAVEENRVQVRVHGTMHFRQHPGAPGPGMPGRPGGRMVDVQGERLDTPRRRPGGGEEESQ